MLVMLWLGFLVLDRSQRNIGFVSLLLVDIPRYMKSLVLFMILMIIPVREVMRD